MDILLMLVIISFLVSVYSIIHGLNKLLGSPYA